MSSTFDLLALVGAGTLAGIINAIAGGGTFFTFATLMAIGLPPVAANATSAVSVLPGQIASALAYRREIAALARVLVPLCAISAVGGLFGGWLLLNTDDTTFRGLVPWLLLFATILFAVSPRIPAFMQHIRGGAGMTTNPVPKATIGALALQGIVAIYGGYFGAGMGIMMLASLSIVFGDRFHDANASKNILAVFMQGFAVILFVFSGLVQWPEAVVITLSSITGGFLGVVVARRVPVPVMRWTVVAVGAALSAWYFVN
ncbi:sulfite exporter TauE/SafE family protein [Mesobaculum littorinae]|uniref:Probable membrane transporter protein n=1 Tax=Mesobaculum littorinae TaxID=2486419 RepID=A0A438AL71_9RHOB|nr:sulfite exporter TauE/SafE family protein [Mesobaculum littorinae]RVV99420.1 sulfite exporter TauE/SafE family protein [Mesobaculum littorinae]